MDIFKAEDLFKAEKINELASSREGLLFLKLKSLNRSEYIAKFLEMKGVKIETVPASQRLKHAYDLLPSLEEVDKFIKTNYNIERSERRKHEADIVNELYKLQVFDWGGLHQNSLEKTIVDNYIKRISKFDEIEKSIRLECLHSPFDIAIFMQVYLLVAFFANPSGLKTPKSHSLFNLVYYSVWNLNTRTVDCRACKYRNLSLFLFYIVSTSPLNTGFYTFLESSQHFRSYHNLPSYNYPQASFLALFCPFPSLQLLHHGTCIKACFST